MDSLDVIANIRKRNIDRPFSIRRNIRGTYFAITRSKIKNRICSDDRPSVIIRSGFRNISSFNTIPPTLTKNYPRRLFNPHELSHPISAFDGWRRSVFCQWGVQVKTKHRNYLFIVTISQAETSKDRIYRQLNIIEEWRAMSNKE